LTKFTAGLHFFRGRFSDLVHQDIEAKGLVIALRILVTQIVGRM